MDPLPEVQSFTLTNPNIEGTGDGNLSTPLPRRTAEVLSVESWTGPGTSDFHDSRHRREQGSIEPRLRGLETGRTLFQEVEDSGPSVTGPERGPDRRTGSVVHGLGSVVTRDHGSKFE